jgi:hypothetical protein
MFFKQTRYRNRKTEYIGALYDSKLEAEFARERPSGSTQGLDRVDNGNARAAGRVKPGWTPRLDGKRPFADCLAALK